MGRKSLSKKLRFEILKRDEFKCRYCGRTQADGATLHVDHVIPVALGGHNDHENLVASCSDCNLGKTSNLLSDPRIIGVDYEKQLEIIAKAQESLDRYQNYLKAKDAFEYRLVSTLLEPMREIIKCDPPFHVDWDYSSFWQFGDHPTPECFPPGMKDCDRYGLVEYAQQVENKVKGTVLDFFQQLGADKIISAAKITQRKFMDPDILAYACPDDAFSYFCGVCHKRIQQEAEHAN